MALIRDGRAFGVYFVITASTPTTWAASSTTC